MSKNSAAIHEVKPVLILDKSINLGLSILDLSKLLIYDFQYNYKEAGYGFRSKLLFTNRDSVVYEIEADDVYEDFYEGRCLFDFSDYSNDPRFYESINKTVIGRMKDEVRGNIINGFADELLMIQWVCSNQRYILCPRQIIKKSKKQNTSINVLFGRRLMRHDMERIQNKL